MNSFEIARYQSSIPTTAAEQLATLFERNYPDFHSEEDRALDIAKHSGAVAIRSLLNEGRSLYVVSQRSDGEAGNEDVSAFLESRIIEQAGGAYEQLSWIMTDKRYRGQGLATLLHDNFIVDANMRSTERLPKPSLALLSVHGQNPALDVYRRWGYRALEESGSKILMVKDLPADK